jgi:hypothetical protein
MHCGSTLGQEIFFQAHKCSFNIQRTLKNIYQLLEVLGKVMAVFIVKITAYNITNITLTKKLILGTLSSPRIDLKGVGSTIYCTASRTS